MLSNSSQNRIVFLTLGLLVLLAPVVLLVLTLGFLVITGDLVLGRVTPLEFLELYIIDLVVLVAVGYGVYRLTIWLVAHRLPASLDELDEDVGDDGT
ncbi:hypothetical protein [Haloplanus sp.]|uniref:hypothetical protein n=1 Tax=Haloplanus sp. TaxID=1961696 RepID=UPI0026211F03|nr:hypothetical protein [Haloplanus sp.]